MKPINIALAGFVFCSCQMKSARLRGFSSGTRTACHVRTGAATKVAQAASVTRSLRVVAQHFQRYPNRNWAAAGKRVAPEAGVRSGSNASHEYDLPHARGSFDRARALG
ncbi:hypothetical protein, partial [Variovorax sp. YR216]|uniref:hypothetical protein n=1 Tax=Variovorax sp. YR216 TaxID=1882828 RepID=UPI001C408D30